MNKLIIEVRINEYASRGDGNRNIPYTADEIAADATACRSAGASIIHFHARKADGSPDHGATAYRDIARCIRESTDVLIHPTLGFTSNETSDRARLEHVLAMAEDPVLRPELAPLDMGSMNLDRYNEQARRFETEQTVYRNSTGTLTYFADALRAASIKPYLISWNLTFTRQAEAMIAAGIIDGPVFMCLCLTENGFLSGHPGTARGLQAHLDFLPEHEGLQWSVFNYGGNLLPLAGTIIAAGGHISIGLGDYPYTELGEPTNADLVARVADIARACGREVASPAETRAMLAMPTAAEPATAARGATRGERVGRLPATVLKG